MKNFFLAVTITVLIGPRKIVKKSVDTYTVFLLPVYYKDFDPEEMLSFPTTPKMYPNGYKYRPVDVVGISAKEISFDPDNKIIIAKKVIFFTGEMIALELLL